MPSRWSMPPQPDQLRRRHDRQHNGEGSSSTTRYQLWNWRKFFNDFSRARACACAQGGVRSETLKVKAH